MKQKILFLISYLTVGIISFFGYKILYNSSFDIGSFCEVSTECFSVTSRNIIYDWLTILIVVLFTISFLSKKNIDFTNIIVVIIFLYNLYKIDSSMSIPLLFVLNLSVISFSHIFLLNKTKTVWVINLIFLFLITLVEIFYISEIFYYNKKYTSIEELMYVFIAVILLISIILSVVGKIYTKKNKFN
mgnify:CR=1 FL=1